MSDLSAEDWLSSFKSRDVNLDFIVNEERKKGSLIAVTGGKGGVGKTSIALKFARELADKGKKTLLIDCDYNLSNTSIKLGIPLNNNFEELMQGLKTFDECLYKNENFHLFAGCNGSLEVFDNKLDLDQIILTLLDKYAYNYDYVFIDCPAGVQKDVMNLTARCDHRFVVVTPDKSSITDAYSLMKILNQRYDVKENHLFVNKVSNTDQYKRIVKTLSETAEAFLGLRTKVLGALSLDHCNVDKFDGVFIKESKSAAHKNFIKIVKSFSDEQDRTSSWGINA